MRRKWIHLHGYLPIQLVCVPDTTTRVYYYIKVDLLCHIGDQQTYNTPSGGRKMDRMVTNISNKCSN